MKHIILALLLISGSAQAGITTVWVCPSDGRPCEATIVITGD